MLKHGCFFQVIRFPKENNYIHYRHYIDKPWEAMFWLQVLPSAHQRKVWSFEELRSSWNKFKRLFMQCFPLKVQRCAEKAMERFWWKWWGWFCLMLRETLCTHPINARIQSWTDFRAFFVSMREVFVVSPLLRWQSVHYWSAEYQDKELIKESSCIEQYRFDQCRRIILNQKLSNVYTSIYTVICICHTIYTVYSIHDYIDIR